MRLEKCDICGREVKEKYKLTELYDSYKIVGVTDVCPECEEELSEIIARIGNAITGIKENWIRTVIKRMKGDKK